MESKGNFFILIIVVAILTLTLAALAGYLFLVQGAPQSKTETKTAVETTIVPKETDLATLALYDGKKYFNLKNEDPKKIAVIQVSIALQYFKIIKEDKKLKVEEKIAAYEPEIRELIGTYFLNVTVDDVKQKDAKEKAKKELKKEINDLMNTGEKEYREYIYKVIFDEWFYQ